MHGQGIMACKSLAHGEEGLWWGPSEGQSVG
jgi:hypothetical protein